MVVEVVERAYRLVGQQGLEHSIRHLGLGIELGIHSLLVPGPVRVQLVPGSDRPLP